MESTMIYLLEHDIARRAARVAGGAGANASRAIMNRLVCTTALAHSHGQACIQSELQKSLILDASILPCCTYLEP